MTTPKTAQELRDLSRRLNEVAQESPIFSVVSGIVKNCCDHIDATARVHEVNARD